ncbi:patatin-like phospholipase family protein [Piscinibacterium candidicorallinum]|uniref:Patatin-like phospholipase family protein n=1 Tax=Piscinibacterium candidicorallinum TaxID=1793872 RepID=A0ABV7H1P9_9BURK
MSERDQDNNAPSGPAPAAAPATMGQEVPGSALPHAESMDAAALRTLRLRAPTPTLGTALVLSGGGARGAYQVGVLRGITDILTKAGRLKPGSPSPFGILTGTSAGAINAAALAAQADDWATGMDGLEHIWSSFSADQVYRADALAVFSSGARWLSALSLGWALARRQRFKPRSLLDNGPLANLLAHRIRFKRIPSMLQQGHLHALSVCAFSYSAGVHLSFMQAAAPLKPMSRSQRMAVPATIGLDHLLASSAIPFVFPARAVQLAHGLEYCGDGAMRQNAPLSPALHLGAQRLLVIGAGRMLEPQVVPAARPGYPTVAAVAGHALSSIFLDALPADVERLQRINRTLSLLPEKDREKSGLRPVRCLLIAPSERLDDIAQRHVSSLPIAVRGLLRTLGADDVKGGMLASYLLFQAAYTAELMRLGRHDAQAHAGEVLAFFNS